MPKLKLYRMNAQSVFGQISIWQVLQNMGVTPNASGVFEDARLRGLRFKILQGGIVETTSSDSFVAGNLVDYLALVMGSYEKAVDHLLHIYGDFLAIVGDLPPIARRDEFIQSAMSARQRFLEFRKLRRNLLEDGLLSQCRSWLLSKGMDPARLSDCVYAGKGSKLNDLVPGAFAATSNYVLFCFMQNPWTYAALETVNVKSGERDWVTLVNSSHVFFGLNSCPFDKIRLHESSEACAIAISRQAAFDEQNLSIFPTLDGERNDFKFKEGIAPSGMPLTKILHAKECVNSLSVEQTDGRLLDVYTHAIQLVQNAINSGGLSKTPDVLAALRKDITLSNIIEQLLTGMGRTTLLHSIKKELDFFRSYFYKSLTVDETQNGYLAKRGSITSRFTNFTIRIDSNLIFPESGDLFYVGRLLFRGASFPISIPRKMITKPRDVETLAQMTISRTSKLSALPVISDTTYQACLGNIISQQASVADSHVGIERLGWATTKSAFITPMWSANAYGVQSTSGICHPGRSEFLTFCGFGGCADYGSPSVPSAEVSASVWTAIAITVAMIAREFLGVAGKSLDIGNDANSLQTIQAVMCGLGQKAPFPINTNVRNKKLSSFDHLSGFPTLVNCPMDELVPFFTQPVFRMCDDGFNFGVNGNDAGREAITALSRKVIQDCVVGIIRTGCAGHVVNPELHTPCRLSQEGRSLIGRFTPYKEVSVIFDRMPVLTNFLTTLPESEIGLFFWFDLEEQAAVINCRRAKLRRGDMIAELTAAGMTPRHLSVHNLLVDGQVLIQTLSDFFGHEIHLVARQDTGDQDTTKSLLDGGTSTISQNSIPESAPTVAVAESV